MVIYLVDQVPQGHEYSVEQSGIHFVDDRMLTDLLANGYEITSTVEKVKMGISATMMVLKRAEDNRGLVTSGRGAQHELADYDDHPRGHGGPGGMEDVVRSLAVIAKDIGRSMTTGAGHLGSAGNHNMPGLTVISGEHVQKAYDMGMLAGHAGHEQHTCPFPPGNPAYMRWCSGWVAGRTAAGMDEPEHQPADLASARARGKADAEYFKGTDVEVSCPYPLRSVLRQEWIEGFRLGGGTIES